MNNFLNTKNNLIYLATPYSKFPKGREAGHKAACEKAAQLMLDGHYVFCPIAHSHSIETEGMDRVQTGDWWLEQDFAVLARCDVLMVYQMPGWDTSYGVKAEIAFANAHGIPITTLAYTEQEEAQLELFPTDA